MHARLDAKPSNVAARKLEGTVELVMSAGDAPIYNEYD